MNKFYNEFTKGDLTTESFLPHSQVYKKPVKKEYGISQIKPQGLPNRNVVNKKTTASSAFPIEYKSKTDLGGYDETDLERLNEEGLRKYSFRKKRNTIIIVILVIFLLLSMAFIGIYGAFLRLKSNCFMHVNTNDQVNVYVDGQSLSEFRCPSLLAADKILELKMTAEFAEAGKYQVEYYFECFVSDELMDNVLVYEPNLNIFKNYNGVYSGIVEISNEDISKNENVISLCNGVMFDEKYKDSLTARNFKLDFYVSIHEVY